MADSPTQNALNSRPASDERERLLRRLADTAVEPLIYVARDLTVQYGNRAFFTWIGADPESTIGKPLAEVFSPDAYEFYLPRILRALEGETIKENTLSRARSAALGPPRHGRISLHPDEKIDGIVCGVFLTSVDIDDEVQLRQQLLDRSHQLELFSNNIPEAIAYLDTGRRYRFVNNAFLQLRGLTREQVIGRTSTEVLGEQAARFGDSIVERALRGETVVYERLVPLASGGARWHRIRNVPDLDASGQVVGMYVVGVDVHDTKLAQQSLEKSEAEIREAIDSLPYPMAFIDTQLRYQIVNRQLAETVGRAPAELIGRDLREIFSERRFAEVEPLWRRVLAGESISIERLITAGDGSERWMLVRYSPRYNEGGQIIGLYSAALDIDGLKKTELELRRANWLLSSHFENTPLAVIEWSTELRVLRWSPQAEKIFGWKEAEVVGRRIEDWKFVHEEDFANVEHTSARMQTEREPRTTILNRNYRKDGRIIWVEWYNSSLRDEDGRVISVFSLAQDVTARVLAEERLVHQATHDALTGLPNRTLLQERLRQAIGRARRSGQRVATLFIDLDRFKDVNDTLGHRIGDELLRTLAKRLSGFLRETDLLVRLSGDEFMVVMEQIIDLGAPALVAEKLLAGMREKVSLEGHDIHVSGSIGISVYPDDANDAEELLKNADMAMYQAKEQGKNAYRVFTQDLALRGADLRLMENALRSAVSERQLSLAYQPKLDTKSGRIIGAEALVRWNHPTRGNVSPAHFIPLAEESGLIHEIGNWVLERALLQLRSWHDAGFTHLRMSINVAAGQFRASHLAKRVAEIINSCGASPEAIDLEITESGLLRDPDGVGATLHALRNLGVRIALDDFGTGYSSLSHVKRFPIDALKIDKSFVADLLTDPDDAAIVSAVTALGRALGLEVIAEGVETQAQLDKLREIGCDSYQGFLASRAVAPKEFETLLWEGNAQATGNA